MSADFQLEDSMPVNTEIGWWNENRRKFNAAVVFFNDWQLEHDFDELEGRKVLARLDLLDLQISENSTFAEEPIERMTAFIRERLDIEVDDDE